MKGLIVRAIIEEHSEKKHDTGIQLLSKTWGEIVMENKKIKVNDIKGPSWGEKSNLPSGEPFASVRKLLLSRYDLDVDISRIEEIYVDLINDGCFEYSHHPTHQKTVLTVMPKEFIFRRIKSQSFYFRTIPVYKNLKTIGKKYTPLKKRIIKFIGIAGLIITTCTIIYHIFNYLYNIFNH